MSYASGTSVSVASTITDIEKTLSRFGADQFMFGYDQSVAMVSFRYGKYVVRFEIDYPHVSDFNKTETGRNRTKAQTVKEWESEKKRRMRSLLLVIKAQLVAVSDNICSFERMFFGNIVLPNNQTMNDYMLPQLTKALDSGVMPMSALPMSEKVHKSLTESVETE